MNTSRHRYRAFGMVIESDLEMSELIADDTTLPVDLRICKRQMGPVEGLTRSDDFESVLSRFTAEDDTLFWPEVATFVVTADTIDYWPNANAGDALISLPLLGAVMSLWLKRRGFLTLHGSAVELPSGVAIFLGDKGAGKSTTAAAMVRAGNALLTDDVVAIKGEGGQLLYPSYPQVKLTAEAESAISIDSHAMPSPHPAFDKARLVLDAEFDLEPRRPTAAFMLVRGEAFDITPFSGPDQLRMLMRFSYATRFGAALINGASAVEHLKQCAELSRTVLVAKLTVPHDLNSLAILPGWLDDRLREYASAGSV